MAPLRSVASPEAVIAAFRASRLGLYAATNVAFLLVVLAGAAVGAAGFANVAYLLLLFALCSLPVLDVRRFNDRYALLALFSLVYFQYFGLLDLVKLFSDEPSPSSGDAIDATEAVILAGGALAQVGYRLACRPRARRGARPARDWPEGTLVAFGLALWVVATWFTWKFRVEVITSQTAVAIESGLTSLGQLETVGLLLASMLQPLAILILAYAHCRYRRPYLLPIVIAVVLVQLVIGFVVDSKGDALSGAVLVLLTRLLVDGRIPKAWLVGFVAFVVVAFPALQANRTIRSQQNLDRAEVAKNLVEVAREALARSGEATAETARAESFVERTTLKGSVHMIVTRTGRDVPYQHGHTLTPIYAAFIPKIVWPDKPDVQTGQLVNSEFNVTREAQAFTYISPSHLGELYWNYGWPGVVGGMLLIGALLGFIGARVDMSMSTSVTKVMIALITIRLLILGFESSVAAQYVVWLRSAAAIGLLHLALARHGRRARRTRPAGALATPGGAALAR